MYTNALKDALANLNVDFIDSQNLEYNRGILLGIVSALMLRMSFNTAIGKVREAMPERYYIDSIPSAWRHLFPEGLEYPSTSV